MINFIKKNKFLTISEVTYIFLKNVLSEILLEIIN